MGPRGLAALQMFRTGQIDAYTLFEALSTFQQCDEDDELMVYVKSVRAEFGRNSWDPED